MRRKKAIQFLSFCVLVVFIYSCGSNAFRGLADESSPEARKYEVSKNLDKGNWDAVINSPYADSMQIGAAYFGRAGYDPADVVDKLIDAKGQTDTADRYLKNLVQVVTESSLNDLRKAKDQYTEAINSGRDDAYFNRSIVNAVESLAIMKTVVVVGNDGNISSCDLNNNDIPDDVDATSCALLLSENISNDCSVSSVTRIVSDDITINNKPGTYTGVTVTVPVRVVGSVPSNCSNTYRKLLYKESGNRYVAVTLSETCTGSDGNQWPCPVTQDNKPLDMVETVNDLIDSMIGDINKFSSGDTSVVESIKELRNDVCGPDGDCTAEEISRYLNKIKK